MKLNKNFIVHNSGDESLLVPTGDAGFSGIVRGNFIFGSILSLLKTDTDENAVVKALCSEYDAPEKIIRADVKKALSELRKIGAIDE